MTFVLKLFGFLDELTLVVINSRMRTPNLYTLQLKLNRYKLAFQLLDDDTIQLGGIKGVKTLRLYYIYLPLIIGLLILGGGIMIDFMMFEACGAVFLLYAAYGAIVVQRKIANNKNIKIIRSGEFEITQDDITTTLTPNTIEDFKINISGLWMFSAKLTKCY